MGIRSFIAVNLPSEIKKIMMEKTEKLRKQIRTGMKWVDERNLHLTLHFLGELETGEIGKVKDILRKTVVPERIRLKVGKIGCFPNQNDPRVLFFECKEIDDNHLFGLQKKIGRGLKEAGFEVEERPWQMHLTFGRVKTPIKMPELSGEETVDKEFAVASVDLMKSDLHVSGPEYTVLEKYSLI